MFSILTLLKFTFMPVQQIDMKAVAKPGDIFQFRYFNFQIDELSFDQVLKCYSINLNEIRCPIIDRNYFNLYENNAK